MPRFNFDLVGACAVQDRHGMIFADCRVAARFADELAAELGIIRPELRNNACVVMTDQGDDGLTYCVAIDGMHRPKELARPRQPVILS